MFLPFYAIITIILLENGLQTTVLSFIVITTETIYHSGTFVIITGLIKLKSDLHFASGDILSKVFTNNSKLLGVN